MFSEQHLSKYHRTSRRVIDDPVFGSQPIAGIRAAEGMARGAGLTAMSTANQYGTEATGIGSMLVPELEKEAMNPTGFNPTDLNAMIVGGQQAAGGTNASIAGEAGLRAARSRNTGSISGILDEAARARGRENSNTALAVQGENARLKERQRQAGLSGLESVRGTDINADLKAQGLVPEDIKAWTDASKSGWLQNTLGVLDTLSGGKGFKIPGLPGG